MTNIEKLADALRRRLALDEFEDRNYTWLAEETANTAEYIGLNIHQVIGLAKGTHVVVPVEPTGDMISMGYEAIRMEEKWPSCIDYIYKAMIKAAQE